MSFQTPITIANAIEKIETNKFLLPAIQREFVWESSKIEWLFDSTMRNYPISSFLFWEVKEDTAKNYKFINDFRDRYNTHNKEISTNGLQTFYAILDGQQRLTSLYIGLKGSYAYKEYRKKWEDTESSIPTRHLYLNITQPLENEEDGRYYEFSFLEVAATKQAEIYRDGNQEWFKVGCILNYVSEQKFDLFVENINNPFSRIALRQLRRTILEYKTINYFLEEEQNLDKALNIFIRINSGGEPLNFSDLLMSIAVANWETKDARKEIHKLVDNIRDKGFTISKDLILKTFLYLHNKDIKFKVTNFTRENAKIFESEWETIRDSILSTFDTIKSFGFTDYTLTSKNAVIPIIYYIYHRDIYKDFNNIKSYKNDREIIKKWLHIVLIKRVFGGTSDNTLAQIRKAFTNDINKEYLLSEISSFPDQNIFSQIRKDTAINDDFIEDILSTQKENKYAFSILSLLYPHLDYKNNNFHKDHIHPESSFKYLSDNDKSKYDWASYNSVCNLQMLDANENMSKNGKQLIDWIELETKDKDRVSFLENHLIPNIDLALANFDNYYHKRKILLTEKLKLILL
ncbi:DUF262 domain-containing protein [Acinetobacter colistiniresistens]|uniref:DUF262 domain-containing protein n=1 Tax=Acinetobacter colistiniresistens TaxID=280145 RepID=UPI00211CCAB0|nr:DUF262 domain-containing protein [Acinetobacter colistiniresistens]UUM28859.1 DUF262 domain-containing protein [Acinetobacter colistiniresistens]